MERVLAIAAHPDDIEFVMSGTMILLGRSGYGLHYMCIANGSCGSALHDAATTIRIRRDEARRAAHLLGATVHESITSDLNIFYDRPTLARLAALLRQVGPSIVLTHSPEDYMEDHMNACRLAVTAAFSRGMPNFPVDPPTPPFQGDVTVYHAQPHGNCDGLGRPIRPDLFVDVTELMAEKTELLACHQSQRAWLDESQRMDSYLQAMSDACAEVGRMSGRFEYAEGWRRHSHLGFHAASKDPLAAAVPAHIAKGPSNGL
jgi:LmbE family N-acetylglucosaminyl deacetylase